MRKFRFRLEALKTLRESSRQRVLAELTKVLTKEQLLVVREKEVHLELTRVQYSLSRWIQPGTLSSNRILEAHHFREALVRELDLLDQQRKELQRDIDRRREDFLIADREFQMLEKLRDRSLKSHSLSEQHREIQTADSSTQHSRRRTDA